MIRLVLVDDQPGVRQGLRMLLTLEPDMTVVGEASTGREAMIQVQRLTPDVVLMDVEMPEMDGIAAAAMLYASTPQSAIVMLSVHDDLRREQGRARRGQWRLSTRTERSSCWSRQSAKPQSTDRRKKAPSERRGSHTKANGWIRG